MSSLRPPVMIRDLDPELRERPKDGARRHDTTAGGLLDTIVSAWPTVHQCVTIGESPASVNTRG
jgi:hypothetical protein